MKNEHDDSKGELIRRVFLKGTAIGGAMAAISATTVAQSHVARGTMNPQVPNSPVNMNASSRLSAT